MAGRSSALISLRDCLRGRSEQVSLLGLADETLTTPSLIGIVDWLEQRIFGDVCAYVHDICWRNATRNELEEESPRSVNGA